MLQDMPDIRKMPLLESLDTETLYQYLLDGKFIIRRYGVDSIVHFSGEACAHFEIILHGKVAVERIDEDGGLMVIAKFSEGDVLGGNLLFSTTPFFPMMISALENTVILQIPRENLFEMFLSDPVFLRRYLQYVADHATLLGHYLKEYVNLRIRQSVISFLEYERSRQNSKVIELHMTKKALAEKIGVQRTSLSRELAHMREDGLIRFDAKVIEILYD